MIEKIKEFYKKRFVYKECYFCGKKDKNVILKRGRNQFYDYNYYFHKECVKDITCYPEDFNDKQLEKCYTMLKDIKFLKEDNERIEKENNERKILIRKDIRNFCIK